MAGREDLEFRITATDDATKVVDGVQRKVDKLEGTEADVTLDAKDEATDRIDDVIRRVSTLDKEDATIILNAEAKKAEAEISKLTRLLADVDGEDATVVIAAKDEATRRLERIEGAMKDVEKRSPVEVDVKTGSGFGKLTGLLDKLPGQMGEVAGGLGGLAEGGAIAGGAAAVGAALFAAVDHAKDLALEAGNVAQYIGSSVEDASRLLRVLESVGVESGDLLDIIGQVNSVLSASPALVEELGVTLKGQSPADVFLQTYNAITKIEDPQRRLLLMQQAFGEEGARQIGALAGKYGDLSKAMEDVPDDLVASPQDVKAAKELDKSMRELAQQIEKVAVKLGERLIPTASKAVDAILMLQRTAQAFLADERELSDVQIAEQFLGTGKSADEMRKALEEAGVATENVTAALAAAGFQATETDRETRRMTGAMGDAASSAQVNEQTWKDQARIYGEVARGVAGVTTETDNQLASYEKLLAKYDQRQAYLNLQQSFDDWRKKLKEGKLTNEELELSVLSLKEETIKYAQQLDHLPPSVKTAVIADIDEASVEETEAILHTLEVEKTVKVWFEPHLRSSGRVALGPDGEFVIRPTSAAAPAAPSVTNVNVHLPRGARAGDIARAISAHTRRSGRRYGAPVVTYARR